MKLRKIFYHYVYDPVYSLWFSVRGIWDDFIDIVVEFKKPKMWSSILYAVCFYAFLTKNKELFIWAIPAILLVYFIRQRIDGAYRRELYKKALMLNNEDVLQDEYTKYLRECHFIKQEAQSYEDWKKAEKEKMNNSKSDA